MSRSYVADEFYAAYITREWTMRDGTTKTSTINYGPYDTLGKAKSALTLNSKYYKDIIDSGLRRGTVNWEEVDHEAEKKKVAAEKRRIAAEKKAEAKREEEERIARAKQAFLDEFNC
jgi:hypothetical protein